MKIFISSPLGGSPEVPFENKLNIARAMCKYAFGRGHAPFAPHLMYPQFMEDSNPTHRILSISAGIEFLKDCDEIWIYEGLPMSEGMMLEYNEAIAHNIPAVFISKEIVGEYENRCSAQKT